jgi:hypothetical protein
MSGLASCSSRRRREGAIRHVAAFRPQERLGRTPLCFRNFRPGKIATSATLSARAMRLRSFARARIRPRIIRQMCAGLLPMARAKSAWLIPCLTSSTFNRISFTVALPETMFHTSEMPDSNKQTQNTRNICADRSMLPTDNLQILTSFFAWLLEPALFGKPVRNTKLETLRRITRDLKSIQEGDARLSESVRNLAEVANGYDYTIRQSPIARIMTPRKSGNVEEKSRLYVAGCVAAFLWPNRNRFTVIVEQLINRGENRTLKAVQMQIRRFEKTLPLALQQIIEWHYLHFKMFKNQACILNALENKDSWSKHRKKLARHIGISGRESRLLQKVMESRSGSPKSSQLLNTRNV